MLEPCDLRGAIPTVRAWLDCVRVRTLRKSRGNICSARHCVFQSIRFSLFHLFAWHRDGETDLCRPPLSRNMHGNQFGVHGMFLRHKSKALHGRIPLTFRLPWGSICSATGLAWVASRTQSWEEGRLAVAFQKTPGLGRKMGEGDRRDFEMTEPDRGAGSGSRG
jgi:hypothetical protein